MSAVQIDGDSTYEAEYTTFTGFVGEVRHVSLIIWHVLAAHTCIAVVDPQPSSG